MTTGCRCTQQHLQPVVIPKTITKPLLTWPDLERRNSHTDSSCGNLCSKPDRLPWLAYNYEAVQAGYTLEYAALKIGQQPRYRSAAFWLLYWT